MDVQSVDLISVCVGWQIPNPIKIQLLDSAHLYFKANGPLKFSGLSFLGPCKYSKTIAHTCTYRVKTESCLRRFVAFVAVNYLGS